HPFRFRPATRASLKVEAERDRHVLGIDGARDAPDPGLEAGVQRGFGVPRAPAQTQLGEARGLEAQPEVDRPTWARGEGEQIATAGDGVDRGAGAGLEVAIARAGEEGVALLGAIAA